MKTHAASENKQETVFLTWHKILAFLMVSVGIGINLMFISLSIKWGCEAGTCGLWIGEWHYHDALWHIAVSRISFTSFPLVFPSAAGFQLSSYNYLLGLILHLFELARINAFIAYFYILPIVANVLFLHALTRYMRKTAKTPIERLWILFFSYLASSFSYLLIFYRGDLESYSVLKGFPVVTTLQPSIVLSNIQFYLSLSLFLYILTDVVEGRSSRKIILVQSLLLVLCIGLKIYTGILTILVLAMGYLYWTFQKKSLRYIYHLGFLGIASICSYLVFYLPWSSYVKGVPFAFFPLSIPHTLTESPNLFYSEKFTLGRYYMIGLGRWSPRLIAYETFSIILFVFINLGTRSIFVLSFFKDRFNLERALLLAATTIGLVIPIFFIQDSGGWYNSIQFAYISVYTSGILAATFMTRVSMMNNKGVAVAISLFIVVASVPNTLITLKFLTKEKILISSGQLKALEYLRSVAPGVTLSLPDSKSSSYVPVFTGKLPFLVDEEQSDLLKLPIKDRKLAIDTRECGILDKIDYLYLNNEKGREFLECTQIKDFKKVYDTEGILIYRSSSPRPEF